MLIVLSTGTLSGCGEFFANQAASLGGDMAGARGSVRVLVFNHTPHRAVFTFGTYDSFDQRSRPDFEQFGPNNFDTRLEGDTVSSIRSIDCGRVFAIGSSKLLALIQDNLPDATIVEGALVEGVEFFRVDADDNGDEVLTSEGFALPFEALLGVDFPCNALVLIRFELNDAGPEPFRIDFQLIPSESDR